MKPVFWANGEAICDVENCIVIEGAYADLGGGVRGLKGQDQCSFGVPFSAAVALDADRHSLQFADGTRDLLILRSRDDGSGFRVSGLLQGPVQR